MRSSDALIPAWRLGLSPRDARGSGDHKIVIAGCLTARTAGWSDPETATAILAVVVHWMRERAGDAPTRETLASVIMQMDE